jgi:hypothetical protein
MCKEKIAKSTEGPAWYSILLKGGYNVQPVPTPSPIKVDKININNAGGSNQKLKEFSRGNAISGAPINKGINQLPNPPIRTGIIKKKIITTA